MKNMGLLLSTVISTAILASTSVSMAKTPTGHRVPTQAQAACDCGDDLQRDITEGKILAAEIIGIEEMKKDMLSKIKQINKIQEKIGLNENDSNGRLAGLGQLIEIMEDTYKEAKKENSFESYAKAQREISDLHKEALKLR